MRVMLAAIVLGALVMGNLSVRAQQSASDAALHLRIAQKAVEDGEFEIAVSEVRTAATLAPTDPVIQFALATVLDKLEETDEALAALDKAETLKLPESLRETASDLRVSLLYKKRKGDQSKGAERRFLEELRGTWVGRSETKGSLGGPSAPNNRINFAYDTTLDIAGEGDPLTATFSHRVTANGRPFYEIRGAFELGGPTRGTRVTALRAILAPDGFFANVIRNYDRIDVSDETAVLKYIGLAADGRLETRLTYRFGFPVRGHADGFVIAESPLNLVLAKK